MKVSMSGVVAAQHAHLRAAAAAGGFDRLAAAVEHAHVADRAAGVAVGGADPGALRADAREVVADAAAAPHRFGRLGQRGVDAGEAVLGVGDRVTHGLHEAVDERGAERRAGGRGDAAGGDEAAGLRVGQNAVPSAPVARAPRTPPAPAPPGVARPPRCARRPWRISRSALRR